MGILDIARSTLQEVSKKISKDSHDGFVQWKGRDLACKVTFRVKINFKPDISWFSFS
jgi:hypothetical protein